MQVGLDTKAVQEAYKAVQEAHPTLPSLYVTADLTGCTAAMSLLTLELFDAEYTCVSMNFYPSNHKTRCIQILVRFRP